MVRRQDFENINLKTSLPLALVDSASPTILQRSTIIIVQSEWAIALIVV